MIDWIKDHQTILWMFSIVSLAILIASILIIPALVARIRPDYFAHEQRPPSRWAAHHPAIRVLLHIGKNLLGATLMIAGLAMLALPGQGLLTVLIGFLLLDFPGKYKVEQWLMSRRAILGPLNWLRRRGGRDPLQIRPAGPPRAKPRVRSSPPLQVRPSTSLHIKRASGF